LDPSGPIVESILMQKQPNYSIPSLTDDSDNRSGISTFQIPHQQQQDLPIPFQDPPSTLISTMESPTSNFDDDDLSDFHQFPRSFVF
jgi:hypothetical protein